MSILYPRLPLAAAEQLIVDVDHLAPAFEHRGQIYAPVGGRRATQAEVAGLGSKVRDLAREFGFPDKGASRDLIDFDRGSARLLVAEMDLSWSEAAAPGVWSFLALVLLPDVTRWRFGTQNRERWIASDMTRHTWARAWWRGTVFADKPDLFDALSESDLNQILERRVIGGDVRLVTGVAQAVLDAEGDEQVQRRALIRDAAARLRRRLAFVDPRALDDDQVLELCREIVTESASQVLRVRA